MRLICLLSILMISINACCIEQHEYKSYLDLNNDGVMDVSYIIKNGIRYELIDSNFDGIVDVKNVLRDDQTIEYVHYDQNYDGWFESKDFMADGVVKRTEINLVEGGEIDIVYIYPQTEISCSARIYMNPNKYIERITYKFGVPEEKIKLNLDFLDSKAIKDQLISACRESL